MNFFKPMARFHLPFSNVIETIVRSISMYLLGQYFGYKKGLTPDMDLIKLNKNYETVQKVNIGFLARISNLTEKDLEKNAIIILNSLAQIIPLEIEDCLNSIEHMYTTSYLK